MFEKNIFPTNFGTFSLFFFVKNPTIFEHLWRFCVLTLKVMPWSYQLALKTNENSVF